MTGKAFGITWSVVEHYLRHGLDTTFRLNGTNQPNVDYVVIGQEVELRIGIGDGSAVPRSGLRSIRIDEIWERNLRMARIRTVDPTLRRDFHDLVCAIAERVVLHGHALDRALHETINAWNSLIRGPRLLQQQRILGLMGELAVLGALGQDTEIGWDAAIEAWVGSAHEEHDFALAKFDIEVKVTSLTKPIHIIHGASQLTPKSNRCLWFVSIQVTRGGAAGTSLDEMVAATRQHLFAFAPKRVAAFDAAVSAIRGEAEGGGDDRWILASKPGVFAVNDNFPRLDQPFLDRLPDSHRSRVELVSYRIDLSGMLHSTDHPQVLSNVNIPLKG